MAKKIRFPLEINGTMIRTLEELVDNFNLEQIRTYYKSGKLETWLRDRQYDQMADELAAIDKESIEVDGRLSEILLSERGNFAVNQNGLQQILDNGMSTVYLCGGPFEIPIDRCNITYIGINEPTIVVPSDIAINWREKGIAIKNCVFDKNYQIIANVNKMEFLYKDSGVFGELIQEVEKVKRLYDCFQAELGNFEGNEEAWKDINKLTEWRVNLLKLTRYGVDISQYATYMVVCRALIHTLCDKEPESELANRILGEVEDEAVKSAIGDAKKAITDFFFAKNDHRKFAYEIMYMVVMVYAVDNAIYNQGLNALSEFVYLLDFDETEIKEWCSIIKAVLSHEELNVEHIDQLPELDGFEFSELAKNYFYFLRGEERC